MNREEQIKEYISTFIEQYAESVGCHPKEVEHLGNFIRVGINWADRHPKDGVNWRQVRIQASIAAMQGMLSNNCSVQSAMDMSEKVHRLPSDILATIAVSQADALIEELKGEIVQ